MFSAPRYFATMIGGLIIAAVNLLNYNMLSCQLNLRGNESQSQRAAQAIIRMADTAASAVSTGLSYAGVEIPQQLVGAQQAVVVTADSILSPEEREERDRRIMLSESVSDLSEISEGAFGACLMIMDDNHFLVEWLAYHYHVLPLRHLTVLVDGKSQTSPLSILERWQGKITIEVVDWDWPGVMAPIERNVGLEEQPDILNYIGRQNKFYEQCMQTYKQRNWNSWVILTDTDEFVNVNRWVDGKAHPLFDGEIPSPNEPGSIMRRIEQMSHLGDTCILTNRTHSCDTTNPIDTKYSAELGFDDHDFLTFEWNLGHTLKNPKAMMNIGAIDAEYFQHLDLNADGNAHNPLPGRECADRPFFRMYHYPGNEAQRTFRDSVDPRGPAATRVGGSRPLIERQCLPMPTAHMHPWLPGFIEEVGQEEATRLLDGVGQTGPWPKYQSRIM